GHDRARVIVARESTHRVDRREPHHRHELGLGVVIAAEKLNAAVAVDLSSRYPDEDFPLEQLLVSVCVRRLCPAVPDAADHASTVESSKATITDEKSTVEGSTQMRRIERSTPMNFLLFVTRFPSVSIGWISLICVDTST